MKNADLAQMIGRSTNEGGCGMSLRPEFYSGCGPSTLDATRMARIYTEIKRQADAPPMFGRKDVPANAHDEYVKMVMGLIPLSATDFLLVLHRLDANDWVYKPVREGIPGISVGDAYGAERDFIAQVGVFNVLSRHDAPDRTYSIVREFLRSIGRKDEIKSHPMHTKQKPGHYDPYNW